MAAQTETLEEFKKLAADPVGKIYVDRFDDSVRVLIMRGPASLCVYLGVPIDHPLAGNSYEDLPIECHGGLTFGDNPQANPKRGTHWPEGFYWYGWDYAHCDDLAFYDLKPTGIPGYKANGKAWTIAEAEKEIWSAVYGMKKLMTVAEKAFAKGAGWQKKQ
jgi:hypothetical protein